MQVKLLRALQEREIRRVGENKNRPIDVRVAGRDQPRPRPGVAGGAFRQDLYYRLKVVELHVPPLRERRDDILPLARVLLADAALRMKRKIVGLAPAAADQLLRYEWPGQRARARERDGARRRARARQPRRARGPARGGPPGVSERPWPRRGRCGRSSEIEKEYILAALELNGGNQTHTAEQLQIGSATLYRKLKSYGWIDGVSGPVPRGEPVAHAPNVEGARASEQRTAQCAVKFVRPWPKAGLSHGRCEIPVAPSFRQLAGARR